MTSFLFAPVLPPSFPHQKHQFILLCFCSSIREKNKMLHKNTVCQNTGQHKVKQSHVCSQFWKSLQNVLLQLRGTAFNTGCRAFGWQKNSSICGGVQSKEIQCQQEAISNHLCYSAQAGAALWKAQAALPESDSWGLNAQSIRTNIKQFVPGNSHSVGSCSIQSWFTPGKQHRKSWGFPVLDWNIDPAWQETCAELRVTIALGISPGQISSGNEKTRKELTAVQFAWVTVGKWKPNINLPDKHWSGVGKNAQKIQHKGAVRCNR